MISNFNFIEKFNLSMIWFFGAVYGTCAKKLKIILNADFLGFLAGNLHMGWLVCTFLTRKFILRAFSFSLSLCLVLNRHGDHGSPIRSVSKGHTCCLFSTTMSLGFQEMLSFADPCYICLHYGTKNKNICTEVPKTSNKHYWSKMVLGPNHGEKHINVRKCPRGSLWPMFLDEGPSTEKNLVKGILAHRNKSFHLHLLQRKSNDHLWVDAHKK